MQKKRILIVLDGLADLPCKELGNKTPLQAANTPNLDKLTISGKLGYMYTIKPGISPESDAATLAILGNDPLKQYTGRGPLEAAGTSIKLSKNFLALRANFATAKGNKVIDRRVGRGLTTREAKQLASLINKKVRLPFKFKFLPTIQHRAILVIYKNLSDNISNVDPAYARHGRLSIAVNSDKLKPCHALNQSKASKFSAKIINSFIMQSSSILKNSKINKTRIKKGLLPANFILLRDAGNKLPRLRKHKDKWLAIAGMPLEIGLARLSGMHVINFQLPRFSSGNIYKNIYASLLKTINIANSSLRKYWHKYNAFYIHLKETDIPGHDGKPLEKKRMIELIDKKFFSKLTKLNAIICITADHSTPSKLRRHSHHPVPVLITGKGKDNIKKLTEKNSRHGSLGKLYGKQLISHLY